MEQVTSLEAQQDGSGPQSPAPSRRRRPSLSSVLMWGLTILVGFWVLYPIAMLLWGSVAGVPPGMAAEPSLRGWIDTYSARSTYRVFANTFVLSVIRTVLSVGLAILFAWVLTRTDVPWRRTLQLLLIAPFGAAPLLLTIAWSLLASPNAGYLNQWWLALFGGERGPFNIYSYGGIVWVGVMNYTALKILLLMPAFYAMDATLEESSTMSGKGRIATLRYITLPLMMPAILGITILSFVRYMESFETELFLGSPAGIYVFTTQIFHLLHDFPVEYPSAMSLSVTLFVMTFVMVYMQTRMLRGRQFTTVSGKSFRTHPTQLGWLRWPVFGFCVLFFVASFLLPVVALALTSLAPAWGIDIGAMTLDNYREVFQHRRIASAFTNTLVLAVGAATVGMILASLIAYVVVRTDFRGKNLLDSLSWVPWTIPSIVLSVAMLWAYLWLPGPIKLYGTMTLLIIAVVTTTLPLAVRIMSGTQVQISRELEESARIHGANWIQTFVYVLLALVKRGFFAGWVVIFVDAVRNLGVVILLYSVSTMPLSVLVFVLFQQGQTKVVAALAILMLAVTMGMLALQMKFSENPSEAAPAPKAVKP